MAAARRSALFVSPFGRGMGRGLALDRNLLGGKGYGLTAMSRAGLPVPPGLCISTEVCTYAMRKGKYPPSLKAEVAAGLARLEKVMKLKLGDPSRPLLVSVRSGARQSMPGMMDTVLNLGLNEKTVEGLAAMTGNPRFAWDAYRRFISMYSDVVLGLRRGKQTDPAEAILDKHKERVGVELDNELSEENLRAIVADLKAWVKKASGKPFPDDPRQQLWRAIDAVFDSWDNDRAIAYRRMHAIPDDWGTAVNVQAMVFGNMGDDSGTGVAFTRNPATGEKEFYGEFLIDAQGEDVVAGTRTPRPILELKAVMPEAYRQLDAVRKTLEDRFGDMQDFEFTVQQGVLYMLQTRAGKRTGEAAVRIATDLVRERKIKPEKALLLIDPDSITQLMAPVFDPKERRTAVQEGRLLATGLNAGPGAASGRIVFSSPDAVEWARRGEKVILCRVETSPEDIRGMDASEGILTARGGMTSHAALVARQMGKVCVAGCSAVEIDYKHGYATINGERFREGDPLSLDGTTGDVFSGSIATRPAEVLRSLQSGRKPKVGSSANRFLRVMRWADKVRHLKVRANADQPDQAKMAVALGAQGIGLCRTEHMFFGPKKLDAVRRMILAADSKERSRALRALLPLQRKDFEGIFRAMGSRPVTVRTLDPPLHEFLPHSQEGVRKMARDLDVGVSALKRKIESLLEANPMLGFRGCRLTLAYPEIIETQARALFEAAAKVRKSGVRCQPEIMIPLVGHPRELEPHADMIRRVANDVRLKTGCKVPFTVGTMIEIPRAALQAGPIAEVAEFFSFGTNDLTQTTLGMSRDDAGTFLPDYVEHGIYDADPFASLDQAGVGRLLELSVKEGREARNGLKVGICGEHGGDPRTVEFCHRTGLDYVSCSPFRIPVARLAAAQAALR